MSYSTLKKHNKSCSFLSHKLKTSTSTAPKQTTVNIYAYYQVMVNTTAISVHSEAISTETFQVIRSAKEKERKKT